jgi:hypothetical protein
VHRFGPVLEEIAGASPRVMVDRESVVLDGIHLTSRYDRRAEAKLQAERVPAGAVEVTVYGIGLGDLPRLLLERSEIERLRVVVLSRAAVHAALGHADPSWLEDERVELVLARDEPALRSPFAVSPACLSLADDDALPVRDAVLLELSRPYQARKLAEREPMVAASLIRNRERVASDSDVAELFSTRVGARAAIAAAGPTLTEEAWQLRSNRPDLVVAVTTALVSLAAERVRPDLVVVIDPKPSVLAHLDGVDLASLRDVPLVYAPAVDPRVLDRWQGPRYVAYLDQPRYAELRGELPRGTLFCSGTVTHSAVDLAVRMGATNVALFGVDFAYVGGRSHARGASEERGSPRLAGASVLDHQGRRVPSDAAFIGFLRDFEGYVAKTPGVRFVSASPRSALMRGVTCKPL